jgi:SAM-dependent methyltransferase
MKLRTEWERVAEFWIAWARTPGHDSYWRFHRDQFLRVVPPAGRRTLDLGCGEGRLARDLRSLGHDVVALDASPTLVNAAHAAAPEIATLRADAAALPFATAAFDLVIAFMSLQDVDDMERAVAESARVLEPGGRLCLATVHPFQSAGTFASDDDGAPFVVAGSYLDEHDVLDDLVQDGLRMTFAGKHRPIERYARALEDAGFLIERIREPRTRKDQSRTGRWERMPLFLHVAAVKHAP